LGTHPWISYPAFAQSQRIGRQTDRARKALKNKMTICSDWPLISFREKACALAGRVADVGAGLARKAPVIKEKARDLVEGGRYRLYETYHWFRFGKGKGAGLARAGAGMADGASDMPYGTKILGVQLKGFPETQYLAGRYIPKALLGTYDRLADLWQSFRRGEQVTELRSGTPLDYAGQCDWRYAYDHLLKKESSLNLKPALIPQCKSMGQSSSDNDDTAFKQAPNMKYKHVSQNMFDNLDSWWVLAPFALTGLICCGIIGGLVGAGIGYAAICAIEIFWPFEASELEWSDIELAIRNYCRYYRPGMGHIKFKCNGKQFFFKKRKIVYFTEDKRFVLWYKTAEWANAFNEKDEAFFMEICGLYPGFPNAWLSPESY
jgi:hypothetical protein